jgi:hypothetical protein
MSIAIFLDGSKTRFADGDIRELTRTRHDDGVLSE